MFYSIISPYDVFCCDDTINDTLRSSNPYDYIRQGYYLDNAALFGGKNYVNFNCNFPGARAGVFLDFSDIRKRTQRNLP